MNAQPDTSRSLFSPTMIIGVALVFLGVLLTLENLLPEHHWNVLRWAFRLWPLILVALGASKWRQAVRENRPPMAGILLTSIGGLLLLSSLGGVSLHDILGPLILVAAGIGVVLMGIRRQRRVPTELEQSDGFLQGTAILSGFKRRPTTLALQGGALTAIFGGFELDLRDTRMEGDSARFDVFLLFGGGEMRIPESWEVVNQANAIAGAVEDKTLRSLPAGVARPRLIITGFCLFGGLSVKS